MEEGQGVEVSVPESSNETHSGRRAFLLFVGSAAVCLFMPGFWGWKLLQIVAVLAIPGSAAAAMKLLGDAFPDLFGKPKVVFPSCVTLPIAHASLIAVIAALGTTTDTNIQRPFEVFLPVEQWLMLRNLALSCLIQCGLLLAYSRVVGRLERALEQASR